VLHEQNDVIESLFVLNERFLKQGARVERLEEEAARVVTLEQSILELNGAIASRNEQVAQLQAELTARDRMLSDATARAQMEEARLGALAERLTQEQLTRGKVENALDAANADSHAKTASIERQRSELERLNEERVLLEQRYAEALAKVAQLEDWLAQHERLASDHASLEQRYAEALAKVAQLEGWLAEHEHLASDHASLERDHTEARTRVSQLERELADHEQLASAHASLEQRHAEAQAKVSQLEDALARQEQMTSDHASLERDHADALAKAAQLEERLAEHDRLLGEFTELAQVHAGNLTRISELEQQLAVLDQISSERGMLEQDNKAAQERIAQLDQELMATRQAVLDRERNQEELGVAMSALRQEGQALVEEISLLKADLAMREEVVREGLDELDGLRREKSVCELENETLKADVAELRKHIDAVEGELAMSVASLRERSVEVARLAAEHERLKRLELERSAATASPAGASTGDDRIPSPARPSISASKANKRRQFSTMHGKIRTSMQEARTSISGHLDDLSESRSPSLRQRLRKQIGLPGQETCIFDRRWIVKQIGEETRVSLGRFLRDPRFSAVDPHPLFAVGHYLSQVSAGELGSLHSLQHYLERGWREGLDPHPYFINDWYLIKNPDVRMAGQNPLEHYLQYGWREGRWPNPAFDPRAYLDRHPDVDRAGMEPLTHFVSHGRPEGREVPIRAFNREWEEFIPASARGVGLMDYLIHSDALPVVDPADIERAETIAASVATQDADAKWPPKPLDDYWLPQTLRDFIIEGYGEDVVDLYWHLCSVMARYEESQAAFADSPECQRILARLKELSGRAAARMQGSPEASIIIPVYNNVVDTMLCLVSVLEAQSVHDYEIIVADDGSADATSRLIPTIGGIVNYLRQPHNFGFLGNCNAAARHARGRYVILLNNDTLVLPNWLDSLLYPFASRAKIGLIGSKLINWDGTLQEAGGIFWKDASAWNFGRGQEARAPEFSYVKDVDYCSGASIALPKALWDQLGGFDPTFSPAYCEDSDIAFRVREAGYHTLFQPHSEVIHHEGRSHGRDVTTGVKAYQIVNQRKFKERWKAVLERDHYANADNVLRARDRSRDRSHILVIDHYVPQFDRDAGSRTMYHYIRTLQDMGLLVTFWPDNLWRDPEYTPPLQELGVEVIYGPRYHNAFADFIKSRADLYDAVLLSRPHVAEAYLPAIRAQAPKARILYYGHDLHFRRMEASFQLDGTGNLSEIEAMRAKEMGVCNQCDVVLYPSMEEVKIVSAQVDAGRLVMASPMLFFDEDQIAQGARRIEQITTNRSGQLLFVGGFNHQPNRDGLLWFIDQVLPILRARLPGISLQIVGSNAPAEILALETDDISVLGFVSDERLEELYSTACLAIAPLRFGAGVKGKVVEAMANGTPVAATTVAAQGLDLGEAGLFIGDTPQDFANGILLGLRDRGEAENRARAALDYIRHHYTRQALKSLFHKAIFGDAMKA
jgi:GT2 family glycosyltransferase